MAKKESDTGFPYNRISPLRGDNWSRVLVLESGKRNQPLVGYFRDLRLYDIPPFSVAKYSTYLAISYSWQREEGSPFISEEHRSLSICGEQLMLSDGAAEVLRALRQVKFPVHLWIDQVCIIQTDCGGSMNAEKATQLENIHKIYSSAKRTLVWIGVDRGDITTAFSVMKQIYNDGGLKQPLSIQEKRALARFFQRRCFSRGWIFQEYVLSQDLLFCSSDEEQNLLGLDRKESMSALRAFVQMPDLFADLESSTSADELSSSIQGIVNLFQMMNLNIRVAMDPTLLHRGTWDLPYLMSQVRSCYRVTKPEDKLIAFRALIKGKDQPEPFYRPCKEEGKTLFIEYTRWHILATSSLAILSEAGFNGVARTDWPTWSPNWNIPSFCEQLAKSWLPFAQYPICHERYQPVGNSNNADVLHVEAIEFDTIEMVSDLITPEMTYQKCLGNATQPAFNWHENDRIIAQADLRGHSEDSAHSTLLLGGRERGDKILKDFTKFKDAFSAYRSLWNSKSVLVSPSSHKKTWFKKSEKTTAIDRARSFARLAKNRMTNRRLFRTKDRKLAGLGSLCIQPGDTLHVLKGANIVFALKKSRESFLLVGECYIFGIGKIKKEPGFKHLKDKWQIIELR